MYLVFHSMPLAASNTFGKITINNSTGLFCPRQGAGGFSIFVSNPLLDYSISPYVVLVVRVNDMVGGFMPLSQQSLSSFVPKKQAHAYGTTCNPPPQVY